jgi:hypothetical protein
LRGTSWELREGAEDAAGASCAAVGICEGFDSVAVHIGEVAPGDLRVEATSQGFEGIEGIEVGCRVVGGDDGVVLLAIDTGEVADGEGEEAHNLATAGGGQLAFKLDTEDGINEDDRPRAPSAGGS